jgi:hypothetical protein
VDANSAKLFYFLIFLYRVLVSTIVDANSLIFFIFYVLLLASTKVDANSNFVDANNFTKY